jgi:hypothetical protein
MLGITGKHFDDAFDRVRGSLDVTSLRRYTHESWQILFNQDQRQILEKAAAIILTAKDRNIPEPEITDLRYELYGDHKKNFARIVERNSGT